MNTADEAGGARPSENGGASDAAKLGHQKAWEANETQEASRGTSENPGEPGSDGENAPDDVGESVSRRAEDIAKKEEEAGREGEGSKGASDRPAGASSGRDATSVKPPDERS